MPSKPDGGPAFPGMERKTEKRMDAGGYSQEVTVHIPYAGMTLRAYFAGQALSQLADIDLENEQEVAQYCVSIADALIAELER